MSKGNVFYKSRIYSKPLNLYENPLPQFRPAIYVAMAVRVINHLQAESEKPIPE
jgi:hypothetical protein